MYMCKMHVCIRRISSHRLCDVNSSREYKRTNSLPHKKGNARKGKHFMLAKCQI